MARGRYVLAPMRWPRGRSTLTFASVGALVGYYLGRKKRYSRHKAFRVKARGYVALRKARHHVGEVVTAGLAFLDEEIPDSDIASHTSSFSKTTAHPLFNHWTEFRTWKRQQKQMRQSRVSRPVSKQYIPEPRSPIAMNGADETLDAVVRQISVLKAVSLSEIGYCHSG